MSLDPELIRQACLRAAEMLSGMGYTGKYGSFHLLDLNLQSNTLTAILHNLIAWEIGRLDPAWSFHPKGGSTPDLTNASGEGLQVKVTSDARIKGNFVSAGAGFYIAVKYRRTDVTWEKNVAVLARDAMRLRKRSPKPMTKAEALEWARASVGAAIRSVEIIEIRTGHLTREDWDRREGTQWAMLRPDAEARMSRIFP